MYGALVLYSLNYGIRSSNARCFGEENMPKKFFRLYFWGCEIRLFESTVFLPSATRIEFILITYIAFLTKLQKRQIRWNEFGPIKKRYRNLNLIPATERYIAGICYAQNLADFGPAKPP